jgi:hypothetical protein
MIPTRLWDKNVCPFVKVATIQIPAQEFDQSLCFTPGHTGKEHEPLGSVNTSGLKLYQTIASNRLNITNTRRLSRKLIVLIPRASSSQGTDNDTNSCFV